jgi:hypothetical protein
MDARLRLRLDAINGVGALAQLRESRCLLLTGDLEFFFLSCVTGEPGAKCGLCPGLFQFGFDRPELLRRETLDFAFAFGDQADGDRLHATSGEALADLLPEERAQLVADETVKDAAGLLGVHEFHVYVTRVIERFVYGGRRNLVEDNTLQRIGAEAGGFENMPGNGLAFAVGVGGQVDD